MAVAVDFDRVDVELNELSVGIPFAMAARQKPVKAGAYEDDHIGFFHYRRAGRQGAQRMVVGQQTLCHRHGVVWNACRFDQIPDLVVDLSIGGSFTQQEHRLTGAGDEVGRTLDRIGIGSDFGHGVDRRNHGVDESVGFVGVDDTSEARYRHVEIDAAGASADGCAIGAHNGRRDVFRLVDAVGGFDKRARYGELVEFLVGSLLHVDGVAVARTRDLDHRVAVDGGVDGRCQAVEKTERADCQQNARCLCQEAVGGGGHAGLLLMAEADKLDALFLSDIGDFCNGNADETIHLVDADLVERHGKHAHSCDLIREGRPSGC